MGFSAKVYLVCETTFLGASGGALQHRFTWMAFLTLAYCSMTTGSIRILQGRTQARARASARTNSSAYMLIMPVWTHCVETRLSANALWRKGGRKETLEFRTASSCGVYGETGGLRSKDPFQGRGFRPET